MKIFGRVGVLRQFFQHDQTVKLLDHFVKSLYYLLVSREHDELEKAKASNLGQVLLKAARLYNEQAIENFNASRKGKLQVRTSHMSLFPHIDWSGTRTTTLAERLGISKQAVGQLVDDLEGEGIVRRIPDPSDGRAKLVVFTKRGEKAIFEGLDVLDSVEKEVQKVLGQNRSDRLRKDLLKVIAALEPH